MPKRKRSDEEDVEKLFFKCREELHHALKVAKGYERQRQSKRLRDARSAPEKKDRVQKEVAVLKSLDLYQAAHAHLCFSLLRIKRIADSPKLPEQIKAGIAKPELTEEEKACLHNVTSSLCSRQEVRTATDKAIVAFCNALGLEVPEKKGKKGKNQPADKEPPAKDDGKGKKAEDKKDAKKQKREKEPIEEDVEESRPDKKAKKTEIPVTEAAGDGSDDSSVDMLGEETISKMADLLGSSSDTDGDDELEEELSKAKAVKKQTLPKELDPMEITSDEGEGDDDGYDGLDPMEITDEEGANEGDSEEEEDEAESDEEFEGFSDSDEEHTSKGFKNRLAAHDSSEDEDGDDESDSSAALSPPQKKKKSTTVSEKAEKKAKKDKKDKKDKLKANKHTDIYNTETTFLPTLQGGYASSDDEEESEDETATKRGFLPSLMGGYISNSESEASDLDVAPARKNRRGQRARQAIWEKKFKAEAKHLKKQQEKGGRDAGWDLKRGAVEGGNTPWKKGIRNPFAKSDTKNNANLEEIGERKAKPPAPKKRDDEGPLHPSWEAKKKLKEKLAAQPFQGKKITFD